MIVPYERELRGKIVVVFGRSFHSLRWCAGSMHALGGKL
jgi:hypothetical protein